MPAPLIPRTPIQTFTKTELDIAELCARALWYGLSFETGKKVTSDAWLLDAFSTPFYQIKNTTSTVNITDIDVHALVVACVLYATFRDTNKTHYNSGINCISSKIYPIYLNYQNKIGGSNVEQYGALAVKELSNALAMQPQNHNKPNPHRTVLSSRIMFFLVPTMPCFNMNNRIALIYGLQSRPFAYRDEYCTLMYKGLQSNSTLLNQYTLPKCTDVLSSETWAKINASDWWQRRVLDIAILIKNNLAKPIPNLNAKLTSHINSISNKH